MTERSYYEVSVPAQIPPTLADYRSEHSQSDPAAERPRRSRHKRLIVVVIVIAAAAGGSWFLVDALSPSPIALAMEQCGLGAEPGAQVGDGGSSVTLDTRGEDELFGLSWTQFDCMVSALEVPDAIQSRIMATRALDGVQTGTYDDMALSWSYHPDSGATLIAYED